MSKPTWRERIGQVALQDVEVEKPNGARRSGIKAYIVRDPDEILIPWTHIQIPVEVGDTIIRYSPAGSERLTVLDPGYHIRFNPDMPDGYPEHYAIRYQREATGQAQDRVDASPAPVVYNLNGDNSRVNIHSQDYSTNTIAASQNKVVSELAERQALVDHFLPRIGSLLLDWQKEEPPRQMTPYNPHQRYIYKYRVLSALQDLLERVLTCPAVQRDDSALDIFHQLLRRSGELRDKGEFTARDA